MIEKRKDAPRDEDVDSKLHPRDPQASATALLQELEQAKRRAERLSRLGCFFNQTHQATSKESLFEHTARAMRALFDVQRASVTLLNESRDSFDVYALDQDTFRSILMGSTIPLEGNAVGVVVDSGQPFNCPDLSLSPLGDHRSLHGAGIRSTLQAPLVVNDHTIGSMNLGSARLAAFDSEDEEILGHMARSLARALEYRRLIALVNSASRENREAVAVAERLRSLNQIAHELKTAGSEQEALRVLAQHLDDVVPFVLGQIVMDNGDSERRQIFTICPGEATLQESSELTSHALDADFRSILESRLFVGDAQIGLIRLHHEELQRYTEQDGQLLDQTMSLVAAAIHEIRLIEDAKKAQRLAESSSAAKSTFVANMSHEIRTPLNAIIGMTSLLAERPLDAEGRQFVETIRGSGEALLTIVSEILDFSKIEAGKIELEEHRFHLQRCLEEVADLFAMAVTNKGLRLSYEIERSVPSAVLGDVARLRQILVNLVGNAIKFTSEGEIRIHVARHHSDAPEGTALMLHFVVSDSGMGIEPSQHASLFDPFTQGDSSMSRRYGGTGLGLSITRGLVELMGGQIWAQSTFGRGSRFHFTVALRADRDRLDHHKVASAASSAERNRSTAELHLAQQHPLRILVAEDNKINQLVMAKLLQRLGYRADIAADGLEALEALERQPYDVILMDMQMPEMDGLTATEHIRQQPRRTTIPQIIAITANATQEDRKACISAGMNDYLSKPVRLQNLADALVSATQRLAGA
ncbi:MAG: response regulator [Myxococcota bacterium]